MNGFLAEYKLGCMPFWTALMQWSGSKETRSPPYLIFSANYRKILITPTQHPAFAIISEIIRRALPWVLDSLSA
jgi:hypothetical protein